MRVSWAGDDASGVAVPPFIEPPAAPGDAPEADALPADGEAALADALPADGDEPVLDPLPADGDDPVVDEELAPVVDVGDAEVPPDGRVLLVETRSLAIDRPAARAPFNTFAARFIRPIASAIVFAETFPARIRSSTASAKRVKGLVVGACRSA